MKKAIIGMLLILMLAGTAHGAEIPELLRTYWNEITPLPDDEGKFMVKKWNVWAIVDADNNILVEDSDGLARSVVSSPIFLIDKWEEVLPSGDSGKSYLVRSGSPWGIALSDGTVILEPCLTRSGFRGFNSYDVGHISIGGKHGMIDMQGNFPVPVEYDSKFTFQNGVSPALKNGLYGLVSEKGEILAEAEYTAMGPEDPLGVRRIIKDGKHGYIKNDGSILIPPIYDEADMSFSHLNVRVRQGDKWGFINAWGEPTTEIIYEDASAFNQGYARVKLNGKWGYINIEGEYIIEARFTEAGDFNSIYAIVSPEPGRWGVINALGEYILDPEYQQISFFQEPVVVQAEKDGGRYYFNLYSDKALPVGEVHASQPFLQPLSKGYIPVGLGKSCFYIKDSAGRMVTLPLYDSITITDDGSASADLNGETIYLGLSSDGIREVKTVGSSFSLDEYKPNGGSKVAVLDDEPTLARRVSDTDPLPALDGATALFPVYSSIVQNLYPTGTTYDNQKNENGSPLVICTKTNEAYRRIIDGRADMIFVAQPSDAQVAEAKAAGIEFELTPFGKEAFVFIVNKDNPLDNITVEQIQEIYSGKITEWSALGIEDLGDIVAYQRPKDSGSQTALEKLMGDIPLMEAPQEVVAWGMGDILDTIEYRNLPNAIGYTFRFFCTEMVGSDVKLLSVDGIAPTAENIRNGSYPITSTLYAVTRKGDTNPNTVALLQWMQTEQAMELVEKSGYIPWYTFDDKV